MRAEPNVHVCDTLGEEGTSRASVWFPCPHDEGSGAATARLTRQQLVLLRISQYRKIDAGPALDHRAVANAVKGQTTVERVEIVGQRGKLLVPLVPAVVLE